jgi:hypothetical protein
MRWVGVVVLLVLSAFFGLLAIGHSLQVEEARRVWATGKVADGTLTAHHGRRKSTVREYDYTYRVEGRELLAEKRSIPWSAREIPVGARLEVRYDPADPEHSMTPAELQELENWANRAFLPLVALAFLGGSIFVALRRAKKPAT